MNIEEFREHCLAVKGAEECFPFDDTVLVFKVMGKMFAFISIAPRDGRFKANLKCDPERSVDLRERYDGVGVGHPRAPCYGTASCSKATCRTV